MQAATIFEMTTTQDVAKFVRSSVNKTAFNRSNGNIPLVAIPQIETIGPGNKIRSCPCMRCSATSIIIVSEKQDDISLPLIPQPPSRLPISFLYLQLCVAIATISRTTGLLPFLRQRACLLLFQFSKKLLSFLQNPRSAGIWRVQDSCNA